MFLFVYESGRGHDFKTLDALTFTEALIAFYSVANDAPVSQEIFDKMICFQEMKDKIDIFNALFPCRKIVAVYSCSYALYSGGVVHDG